MSCQTPMLWALAATGLLYWVVSFQASTRISIILFKRARRGAKGKEATNNVTNPNWITAGIKEKFTNSLLWRGKRGTLCLTPATSLILEGSTSAKHSRSLSSCPHPLPYRKHSDLFVELVMHSSAPSLLFLLRPACLKKAFILVR